MKKYGFIPDKIQEQDYVFGGGQLPQEILCPDGNWIAYIPVGEDQKRNNVETYNCSAFGTLNCLEIIFKKKFNTNINFSERFLGIIAGTRPPGNTPQTVAEAIRKQGVVEEQYLPFDSSITTLEKYYSPDPPTQDLLDRALKWLKEFDFKHEYVFGLSFTPLKTKQKLLKEALKHSPIGVSVYAWQKEGDYYIKPEGVSDTHWVSLIGYEDGKCWYVFDSFPESENDYILQLAWNFDFGQAKKYYIGKKNPTQEEQLNWLQVWFNSLLQWFGIIQEQAKPVLQTFPKIEPVKEIPKYNWNSREDARHSVRVICDEEGLNWNEKTLICRVINCESNFNPRAIHKNTNGTMDYGICQFNDRWWVGEDQSFSSRDEILDNPEKCIRVMIQEYKRGRLNDWVCYRQGRYLQFSA